MALGSEDAFAESAFFSSAAKAAEGRAIASPARLADFRNTRRFMSAPCEIRLYPATVSWRTSERTQARTILREGRQFRRGPGRTGADGAESRARFARRQS